MYTLYRILQTLQHVQNTKTTSRQKSYRRVLQNPSVGRVTANVLRRRVDWATVDVGGLRVDSVAPVTTVLINK